MTDLRRDRGGWKQKDRPRILCIVDTPNWIFGRHVSMLQKYLGNDFNIELSLRGNVYDESQYDLIYPLEFNMVNPDQIKSPLKYVTGIRSFVAWADWDFLVLVNYLVSQFKKIHVVSKQLFDIFSPYIPDLQYVTHGVDTNLFQSSHLATGEVGKLRLGWAGNRESYVKGFREYIQPLGNLPGVELIYVGYVDRNYTINEMPGFYDTLDAYVCASSFEGSNNSILEAAAMERAIITTPNGTVPEFLINNKNALIVDRDVNNFRHAIEKLRDNLELRNWLGTQARISLLAHGWDWEKKAEEYRQFFWDAVVTSAPPSSERILTDITDMAHYTRVLKTQFALQRDLRIGSANECLELKQENKELAITLQQVKELMAAQQQSQEQLTILLQELDNLKKTKFYKLYTKLSSMKIFKYILRP